MHRRRSLRMLLTAALSSLFVFILAGPALAHVTVNPDEAPQGSFQELTFRVPNERDDASTTKVEVNFPPDHPIASVSVRPLAGWTAKVDKVKLATPLKSDDGEVTEAVGKVTWSGGKINPGEYQGFAISAGPLPEGVDKLEFKTLQTYSNGEVVRWIQSTPEGGEEPENPAPTLTLTAATGGEHGGGSAQPAGTSAPASAAAPTADDVDAANIRGTVGIVLGALGLLLAAGALVVALRKPSGTDAGTGTGTGT